VLDDPDASSFLAARACAAADGRGYEFACEVLAKMRGNMRFMRGLQPGRQPQATPTPDSTDMMMKVDAPCPERC
jgi:hypothetical protein